jgi:hypothetical protein
MRLQRRTKPVSVRMYSKVSTGAWFCIWPGGHTDGWMFDLPDSRRYAQGYAGLGVRGNTVHLRPEGLVQGWQGFLRKRGDCLEGSLLEKKSPLPLDRR